MLLGQHRGGGQHGHLFAGGDGLEDGPNSHLGFTKAHVATYQSIHRFGFLHVALYIGDRLELIRGWFIGERLFQFVLPGAIWREAKSLHLMAFRIELHQV